jgi:hypothetical protein
VENAREGRDLKRLDTTETVGRDLATSVQSQSCTDQFEADEMRIDYLVAGEEGPTLAGRPPGEDFCLFSTNHFPAAFPNHKFGPTPGDTRKTLDGIFPAALVVPGLAKVPPGVAWSFASVMP